MNMASVGHVSPRGPLLRQRELRVLTFNLGWLAIGLPGRGHVPLDRHVRQRRAAAPAVLAALDADILVLQEIYTRSDRRFLFATLRHIYPHMAGSPLNWSVIGNGLVVLSRYPISECAFVSHRGRGWTHMMWRQGFLKVAVDVPGHGTVRLVNAHLSASSTLEHPEAPTSASDRTGEITALLAVANKDRPADIIIGDFNMGPTISPENYLQILRAGYDDAFDAAGPEQGEGITWDAENILNALGRYPDSPSQRIDHIFVRARALEALRPLTARVVLKEMSVATSLGPICLSDHYGMLATLAMQRSSPSGPANKGAVS